MEVWLQAAGRREYAGGFSQPRSGTSNATALSRTVFSTPQKNSLLFIKQRVFIITFFSQIWNSLRKFDWLNQEYRKQKLHQKQSCCTKEIPYILLFHTKMHKYNPQRHKKSKTQKTLEFYNPSFTYNLINNSMWKFFHIFNSVFEVWYLPKGINLNT